MDNHYVVGVRTHGTIESFTYTSSLRRDKSITSKVISSLGYLMDFVLLSLMTRKPNVLPPIAAETKDNSWPFGTGIPSIGFKNCKILKLIDMITLCTAMRRHVIKLISCVFIIQCKNISCNKILFFKKKQKYFDDEKDGSTVYCLSIHYYEHIHL